MFLEEFPPLRCCSVHFEFKLTFVADSLLSRFGDTAHGQRNCDALIRHMIATCPVPGSCSYWRSHGGSYGRGGRAPFYGCIGSIVGFVQKTFETFFSGGGRHGDWNRIDFHGLKCVKNSFFCRRILSACGLFSLENVNVFPPPSLQGNPGCAIAC